MRMMHATTYRLTPTLRGLLLVAAAIVIGGCTEASMLGPDRHYGVVTTFTSDIPAKIYPAFIAVIDGRNVQSTAAFGDPALRKHSFRLTPGDHTLRLVADLSQATATFGTGVDYTPRGEQPGVIKVFVEEGRRYYLGARLTGVRRDEWEPVVWSVQDIENYKHTIAQ